jgi:hypothetical protein
MEFSLSDEERGIQEAIHDLATREFAPRAAEYDRSGEFPWANVRLLAENGYLGMTLPAKYGGAEASFLAFAICMEEIARACTVTSVIFEVDNSLHMEPILRFGTEAQRERFLPPLVRGERLGAYCLTEPSSGSDAGAMQSLALPADGGYRLRGQKAFITNGGVADVYIVFARTGTDPTAIPPTKVRPLPRSSSTQAWPSQVTFACSRETIGSATTIALCGLRPMPTSVPGSKVRVWPANVTVSSFTRPPSPSAPGPRVRAGSGYPPQDGS